MEIEDSTTRNKVVGVKVFVGSIPAYATQSALRSYFQRFGKVLQVHLGFRSKGVNHESLNPGHGYILVEDSPTAERIIREENHFFEGRKLACQPFRRGNQLKQDIEIGNRRRVIIKNVHWNMDENEFKNIISEHGEVEYCFFFNKNENIVKGETSKPQKTPRTASIQFVEVEAAERLIEKKSIMIYGVKSKIERYKHKNKQSTLNLTTNSDSLNEGRTSHVQKARASGTSVISLPGRNEDPVSRLPAFQSAIRQPPLLKSIDRFHSMKPTRRIYYKPSPINELSAKTQLSSCIRFNVCVKPIITTSTIVIDVDREEVGQPKEEMRGFKKDGFSKYHV